MKMLLDNPMFAFGFDWILEQLATIKEDKQIKFAEILYYYDFKIE